MAEPETVRGPRAGPSGGRPRSPTRLVTVEQVERVTPRLTRVTFAGPALAGFGPPRPGAHIKLIFPPTDAGWTPGDETAPRPPRRTYTPRRFDQVGLRLDVEFVHHGHGLAATWAASARPGEQLYINGPGGGYDVPPDTTEIVLAVDDTALPAAGMILEALPRSARATVLCEVSDAAERRPLGPTIEAQPTWLLRDGGATAAGSRLEQAVRHLADPGPTAQWWIACEAAAMRRIRRHLLTERGIDPARVHSRGYWKLGETAYPDHDYGKD